MHDEGNAEEAGNMSRCRRCKALAQVAVERGMADEDDVERWIRSPARARCPAQAVTVV
jgi:hypothetical protein